MAMFVQREHLVGGNMRKKGEKETPLNNSNLEDNCWEENVVFTAEALQWPGFIKESPLGNAPFTTTLPHPCLHLSHQGKQHL
jgi:hypothetical protein